MQTRTARQRFEENEKGAAGQRTVRLERARIGAGLTIKQVWASLAEGGCVLNYATVYRYFTGVTDPSLAFLGAFAHLVGDSPHRLAFGDEPSPALAAAWLERELDRELARRGLDRQERFVALELGRVKGRWVVDVLKSAPVLKAAADALLADYKAVRDWSERVGGPQGADQLRALAAIQKALRAGQGPKADALNTLMAARPTKARPQSPRKRGK